LLPSEEKVPATQRPVTKLPGAGAAHWVVKVWLPRVEDDPDPQTLEIKKPAAAAAQVPNKVSLPATVEDPATHSPVVYLFPVGRVQLVKTTSLPKLLRLPAEQMEETNFKEGTTVVQADVAVLLPATVELPDTHTADTQVLTAGELQALNTVSLPTPVELPAKQI